MAFRLDRSRCFPGIGLDAPLLKLVLLYCVDARGYGYGIDPLASHAVF